MKYAPVNPTLCLLTSQTWCNETTRDKGYLRIPVQSI